eukprot:m.113507 g.113507  ORF g.113507 m.113507 type:complete len:359 (+) comp16245_c0_seq5:1960-3036(+)
MPFQSVHRGGFFGGGFAICALLLSPTASLFAQFCCHFSTPLRSNSCCSKALVFILIVCSIPPPCLELAWKRLRDLNLIDSLMHHLRTSGPELDQRFERDFKLSPQQLAWARVATLLQLKNYESLLSLLVNRATVFATASRTQVGSHVSFATVAYTAYSACTSPELYRDLHLERPNSLTALDHPDAGSVRQLHELLQAVLPLVRQPQDRFEAAALLGYHSVARAVVEELELTLGIGQLLDCLHRVSCWLPSSHQRFVLGYNHKAAYIEEIKAAINKVSQVSPAALMSKMIADGARFAWSQAKQGGKAVSDSVGTAAATVTTKLEGSAARRAPSSTAPRAPSRATDKRIMHQQEVMHAHT